MIKGFVYFPEFAGRPGKSCISDRQARKKDPRLLKPVMKKIPLLLTHFTETNATNELFFYYLEVVTRTDRFS